MKLNSWMPFRGGLHGFVEGHPRIADGDEITTSPIKGKTATGNVVTFTGGEYELGTPFYEDGDARQKFLDSLQVVESDSEKHVRVHKEYEETGVIPDELRQS